LTANDPVLVVPVESVLNRPVVVVSIPVDTIGAAMVSPEASAAKTVVVDIVSVKILLTAADWAVRLAVERRAGVAVMAVRVEARSDPVER
jgi:hypothetical protein